jgi:hypothetical protein
MRYRSTAILEQVSMRPTGLRYGFLVVLPLLAPLGDADARPSRVERSRAAETFRPMESPRHLERRPAPVSQEALPLPRPRPDTAPAAVAESPPAEPSACQKRLSDPDLAQAEPQPSFSGPGECGGEDLVRLSAVLTKDRRRIAVNPPAIMRCPMAEAVVEWVREDVDPILAAAGPKLTGLANYASYDCRGRNNIAGAKLSQHGLANALDVRGFALADGKMFTPTEAGADRTTRESLRASVCARFTTVLGPGSDGYHESHVHIDRIERRGGYRICQWDIRDPAQASIPLPRERPAEAPPRPDRRTQLTP